MHQLHRQTRPVYLETTRSLIIFIFAQRDMKTFVIDLQSIFAVDFDCQSPRLIKHHPGTWPHRLSIL
ncbi:hypothetical protein DIE19_28640 [Burkholderia sp. Bp9126]|nr:hypothetical protein DIE19_28640 [Burkholderia sp. Bp9126]